MPALCLIRHGQSQWNLENRFTGWVDVPLSPKGREEALKAGGKISSIKFDIAYTSTLKRAQETLLLACSRSRSASVPVFYHTTGLQKKWQHHKGDASKELKVIYDEALNERYYGNLQGLNKAETAKRYGEEKVHLWRRSFDIRPPGGESLKDTCLRTTPYLKKHIMRDLRKGLNVLLVAHGNSLRAVVKELERIPDDRIADLEIPTGVPYVYRFSRDMKLTSKRRYP